MKKVLFAVLFAAVAFVGCQKATEAPVEQAPAAPAADAAAPAAPEAPAAPQAQ